MRAVSEAVDRLLSEPAEMEMAGVVSARLMELVEAVAASWRSERLAEATGPAAFDHYVNGALDTVRYAVAGLGQRGADVRLLAKDFQEAALPLEVFLKGLDQVPVLQRTA